MLNSSGSSQTSANPGSLVAIEEPLHHQHSHYHLLQQQQQQQQQSLDFPSPHVTNPNINTPAPANATFDPQEGINSLIEIITKKQELLKSLNELNKKESYLRSKLDMNASNSSDVAYAATNAPQVDPVAAGLDNSAFIKLEQVDLELNSRFKGGKDKNSADLVDEEVDNEEDEDDDDDEENEDNDDLSLDLSNPDMTFISGEQAANVEPRSTVKSTNSGDNALPVSILGQNNVNIQSSDKQMLVNTNANTNSNTKRPKTVHVSENMSNNNSNEADLDAVNSLYNKLLIHNSSSNSSSAVPPNGLAVNNGATTYKVKRITNIHA